MPYLLLFFSLFTLTLHAQSGPPARGQVIQTPTKTYYNYYDEYGNPYLPGQPSQGRPSRSGTRIIYDNSTDGNRPNVYNRSSYTPSSSVTGPPGSGRPYREGNKIIYR